MIVEMKTLPASPRRLKYQQAVEHIEKSLRYGNYEPGAKLPPMREFSQQMGINYATVRRAMIDLKKRGVVTIQHGAGTFLTESAKPAGKALKIALACPDYMMHMDQQASTLGAILTGAHERCRPPDVVVQPLFYRIDHFTEDLGQTIIDQGIEGIVLFRTTLSQIDYQFLKRHNVHVVEYSYYLREDDGIVVIHEDTEAQLRLSVEHLRLMGHERIGLITYKYLASKGPLPQIYAKLVYEYRLGNPQELILAIDNPRAAVKWDEIENFFTIDPLPSAVILMDEFMADVFLDVCQRRTIKVPDSLAVVALQDCIPFSHQVPLTTVLNRRDICRIVNLSCDLLLRRINGETITPSMCVIEPRLTVKSSSIPPVRNDDARTSLVSLP